VWAADTGRGQILFIFALIIISSAAPVPLAPLRGGGLQSRAFGG
jgi:hypothetical protein